MLSFYLLIDYDEHVSEVAKRIDRVGLSQGLQVEVNEMPGTKIIYDSEEAADLVKLALAAERKRLEIGLKKTKKAIAKFEEQYRVSSETFLAELAAEDLEGGHEEYVQWAGELQIRDRILQRLRKLDDVE